MMPSCATMGAMVAALPILVVLAVSAPARAQGPLDPEAVDPRIEQARALFEEAVAAFDAQDYGTALPLFEQSYSVRESALVLFNIAVTEQRLGRDLEGHRHFREYLRSYGGEGGERAAVAERESAALLGRLARVRLNVMPGEAIVTLDGMPMDASLDEDGVVLRPGAHALVAEAPDHERAELSVTLGAGEERTITLQLEPVAPPPDLQVPAERMRPEVIPAPVDDGGMLESPAFWIVAGVVAAGVGVALAVLLSSAAADDSFAGGDYDYVVEALTF